MKTTYWYAMQRDAEDDWGTGFFSREEAINELANNDYYSQIAVIEIVTDDNGNESTLCVEEIKREDI